MKPHKLIGVLNFYLALPYFSTHCLTCNAHQSVTFSKKITVVVKYALLAGIQYCESAGKG